MGSRPPVATIVHSLTVMNHPCSRPEPCPPVTSAPEAADPATAVAALAGKYLTFYLGEESYGVSVLEVREIIRPGAITAVPHLPDHVRGVIHLRGKGIPVVCLRTRFGLAPVPFTERTCIVVVQIELATGVRSLLGLVVGEVDEVVPTTAPDMTEPPAFSPGLGTGYLPGIARVKEALSSLLDLGKGADGASAGRQEDLSANLDRPAAPL
jgi:purine-binding chemotaxis protein CheW